MRRLPLVSCGTSAYRQLAAAAAAAESRRAQLQAMQAQAQEVAEHRRRALQGSGRIRAPCERTPVAHTEPHRADSACLWSSELSAQEAEMVARAQAQAQALRAELDAGAFASLARAVRRRRPCLMDWRRARPCVCCGSGGGARLGHQSHAKWRSSVQPLLPPPRRRTPRCRRRTPSPRPRMRTPRRWPCFCGRSSRGRIACVARALMLLPLYL